MDFGQKTKSTPWHAKWQGRLWLAVSVPIWLIGLSLPLFRWEGPPPHNLFFQECHLPETLPLTSRPQPPAGYCEVRRDAATEYAKRKWERLNPGEALDARIRILRQAMGESHSEEESDRPQLTTQTEDDLSRRTAYERRVIEQTFRRYRDEVSLKYQVAECHLDGTCEKISRDAPHTNALYLPIERDKYWREPCGPSERAVQRARHERALSRCAAVKADPQRRNDAVLALNYERSRWAIALLLPTLLLLVAPFVLAGGGAIFWTIYRWIRRGAG